jgi:hypothetical protein
MIDAKTLTRVSALVAEAKGFLEHARDEAVDKFEERPEKWRESEAGQAMDEKIAALGEAIEALEQVETNIETATA